MRIKLNSIFVQDQDAALAFYTDVLGFEMKVDIPFGEYRWLTVVAPEEPAGTELVLEPATGTEAGATYQQALFEAGIPITAFAVDDVQCEFERLSEQGVVFTQGPADAGGVTIAVFEDTCGNLIQIYDEPSQA